MTPSLSVLRAALTVALFAISSISSAADLLSPSGRADRIVGAADAPVTLIEYSSPTCGYCVAYHREVAPRIKSTYIDTGKVRLLYRPFVRNAVDAAIFMLAESRPAAEYDAAIDAFYARYDDITATSNVRGLLEEIAAGFGIGRGEFEKVLSDQRGLTPIQSLTEQAVKDFGVTGTPSFFVNGKLTAGGLSFEAMSRLIEEEIPD